MFANIAAERALAAVAHVSDHTDEGLDAGVCGFAKPFGWSEE